MKLNCEEKEYRKRIRQIFSVSDDLFTASQNLKNIYQEIENNHKVRLIFYVKTYHSFKEKLYKLCRELHLSVIFAAIYAGVMSTGSKQNSLISQSVSVVGILMVCILIIIIPYIIMYYGERDVRTIFLRNIEKQIIKVILKKKFEIDYEDTE